MTDTETSLIHHEGCSMADRNRLCSRAFGHLSACWHHTTGPAKAQHCPVNSTQIPSALTWAAGFMHLVALREWAGTCRALAWSCAVGGYHHHVQWRMQGGRQHLKCLWGCSLGHSAWMGCLFPNSPGALVRQEVGGGGLLSTHRDDLSPCTTAKLQLSTGIVPGLTCPSMFFVWIG